MTDPAAVLLVEDSVLRPTDAVAAILLTPDNRYLLQLRDLKRGIFFPGHWSFFGGAIDAGDPSSRAALRRELYEELGIDLPETALQHFSKLTFDVAFCGGGTVYRDFFEARLDAQQLAELRLGEGSAVRAFAGVEALTTLRMTPYDSFLLWLHVNRRRVAPHRNA